jgi:hypothetical protein
MSAVFDAYKIIHMQEPSSELADWQVAEAVLNDFRVRELGDDLAKSVIYEIVNYVHFPNQETTTRIVGHAENLATELWDELPDEPHMADIAHLEYKEQQRRSTRA